MPTSGRLLSARDGICFLPVFSRPDSSFLFSAEYDLPVWMDHGLFIPHLCVWGYTLLAFLVQLRCRWLFPSVRPWRDDDFVSGALGHSANVLGGDKGTRQNSTSCMDPKTLGRTGEPKVGVTGRAALEGS